METINLLDHIFNAEDRTSLHKQAYNGVEGIIKYIFFLRFSRPLTPKLRGMELN